MRYVVIITILCLCFTKINSQNTYALVILNEKPARNAYINNMGKITYESTSEEKIRPLSEGLGVIIRNGKYGYIDAFGNIKIALTYDDAEDFSEGLAAIKVNGKWGYINKNNDIIIQPTLISNKPFINKVAFYVDETVLKNNLYKFIDTTGKFINSEYYLYANKFSDNCGWVKDTKTKNWGCINSKGEYIIEPKYNRVTYFKNGRCWVETNGKWGYINKKGEYIIEPIYNNTNNELNGYTWVEKNSSWGLLDSTGKVIIPFAYKNSVTYKLKTFYSFTQFATPSQGLLAFNSGSKSGYYDLNFNIAIPPTFEGVTDFVDGLAAVKLNNKWGLIDLSGKLICDYKFHEIIRLNQGLFASEEGDNNFVIFDKTGNQITSKGFARVKKFE